MSQHYETVPLILFTIQTMNPLSRSMRIVRLAQQQVAIETAADMLEESYDAAGCSSQGQLEKEADTSLNDISFTELVPVTGLDNAILINEPDLEDDVDSFNCYLPNVHAKGNIFTNGKKLTHPCFPILIIMYHSLRKLIYCSHHGLAKKPLQTM